jgi:hypothetical protein
LEFFRLLDLDRHIDSRRSVHFDYLRHLHATASDEDRPEIESMLARVISSLIGTKFQPSRQMLETAVAFLTNRTAPHPVAHIAIDEAVAGHRLCDYLQSDSELGDAIRAAAVMFAYHEAMARGRIGDIRNTRRAYSRVIRIAEGSSDARARAFAARSIINRAAHMTPTDQMYMPRIFAGLIAEMETESDSAFAEPYCIASLNHARWLLGKGDRADGRRLISSAIARAEATGEPWTPEFIRDAQPLLQSDYDRLQLAISFWTHTPCFSAVVARPILGLAE